MAFPFEHISEKEKFQYTFLNEVTLKIFPPKELREVDFKEMQHFFKVLFNLDFKDIHREYMLEKRLKVGNQENGVMFEFSQNTIKISIDQNHYSDFKTSMLPILVKFTEAYKFWFDSFARLELKFVDVWPIDNKIEVTEKNIEDLEEAVFSYNLRGMAEKVDENFKELRFKSDELTLSMKYGYYISKNENQNSGVALESKCETKDSQMKADDIREMASRMNDLLYDAFIWAVTPDIIKAMKTLNN